MSESRGLLNCPFCGSGASMQNGPRYLWYVECGECGVNGKIKHSEKEAIAVWNNRARPERVALSDAEIKQIAINTANEIYGEDSTQYLIADSARDDVLLNAHPDTAALQARITELENVIDCACNALTDSIRCSGNDASTNLAYVRKLRTQGSKK